MGPALPTLEQHLPAPSPWLPASHCTPLSLLSPLTLPWASAHEFFSFIWSILHPLAFTSLSRHILQTSNPTFSGKASSPPLQSRSKAFLHFSQHHEPQHLFLLWFYPYLWNRLRNAPQFHQSVSSKTMKLWSLFLTTESAELGTEPDIEQMPHNYVPNEHSWRNRIILMRKLAKLS